MGGLSVWHWAIVAIVGVPIFGGGGRITRALSDMAHGLRTFRHELEEPPRYDSAQGTRDA